MNPKLIFYLADTAVYPLSVVLLIVALKGNVMNAGPALVRIVLFMWTVAFVASLVVARCWLGSAWHALPPLFAAFLIIYLYFSWPQWKNTYFLESFDEECYEEGIARRTGKRLAGLEHGTITYYASDGRIVRSETWKHGDPNGLYRGYHDNGQLAERGVVKRPDTENGDLKRYREGRWKFYREDGTRDDVRTYEKGRVVASQSYAYYKVDQDDRRSRIYRFSDRMPFTGQLEKCGVVDDEAFPLFWTGRIVDGYFDGPWQAGYHLPGSPSAGEGLPSWAAARASRRRIIPTGSCGRWPAIARESSKGSTSNITATRLRRVRTAACATAPDTSAASVRERLAGGTRTGLWIPSRNTATESGTE